MRRLLPVQVLALLALCAMLSSVFRDEPLTSDFSIAGVRLGMSRGQVDELFGQMSNPNEHSVYYYPSEHNYVTVDYDENDSVESIWGQYLEHGSKVLAEPWPSPEGDALAQVVAIVGEPDYSDEPGMSWSHWFERQNLIVMHGCTGWGFFLREL